MSSFANLIRPPCACSRSANTDSTARQGPHQGAQKSTTTGVSARSTSFSKLASVTVCTSAMLETPQEGGAAQSRHLPDRLEHDVAAHLRAADGAVDERDRHLDHAKARAERPVRRLDLEGVAPRRHGVEVDRLEHVAPVALEAAGEVADAG